MAKAKRLRFPKGFKKYDGKGCPFEPEQRVEVVTMTGEGPRAAPPMRAELFDWEWANGQAEIGDVVGFRA